jgi:hypothetical protein
LAGRYWPGGLLREHLHRIERLAGRASQRRVLLGGGVKLLERRARAHVGDGEIFCAANRQRRCCALQRARHLFGERHAAKRTDP